MKKPTVSILGCGWLGFPLAKVLVNEGYQVRGSTTNPEKLPVLKQEGIEPFLVNLNPTLVEPPGPLFFRSEIMVINIPPGRQREDVQSFYTTLVREVLSQKPRKKILFVSSTSVYPDCNRVVNESDSPGQNTSDKSVKATGKALLMAEDLVRSYSSLATIVRFCGLMGPDRHPGRFLAGRQLNSSGQSPVNFIHLDDCIAILQQIVRQEKWGEVYNACADDHPQKKNFYVQATNKLGLEPPQFSESASPSFKEVNSSKLKQQLGYQFKYPDPSEAL
jgi:nucleoside-diphosphate-sugar epimerase